MASKHRRAGYAAQLLSGKTQQEQLEFWRERTERLVSEYSSAVISNLNLPASDVDIRPNEVLCSRDERVKPRYSPEAVLKNHQM